MKLCCIVGAGPSELYTVEGAFIIAADAGIEKLNKAGIAPDLIIGDFDSLGTRPSGENVRVFPVEKDDTDTMLALKEAISLGYDTVIISGGLGGELDHTMANLQTLLYACDNGINAFLTDGITTATVISDSITLGSESSGRCSVFAFGSEAIGVSISGLKYEASGITLSPSFPLGVSNHFVGKETKISLESGRLLIIYNGKPNIKNG
ncbi:MAG: thiamine diphosphokinase [Ruminococcaceae bacterium]|nr:thiamine diphosphokinase [Oscillospiraceae bacterium]